MNYEMFDWASISINQNSGALLVNSTPDAIGKALESYLFERPVEGEDTAQDVNKTRFTMVETPELNKAENYNPRTMVTCPDCGSDIFHENGCVTCPSCGFSKCE